MLNAYDQRLMAFYFANAAAALHHRDREASGLAEWIADRENRVAFGRRKRPSTIRAGTRGRDEGLSGGNWRSLKDALRDEYSAARKARPDRTAQRLRRLAKTTGLSRTDIDVLDLVLRYQTQPVIELMSTTCSGHQGDSRRSTSGIRRCPRSSAYRRTRSRAGCGRTRRSSARGSSASTVTGT